eukprot:COSAG06_NODE_63307_length_262_cov_1.558282_1_plen_40_part_01
MWIARGAGRQVVLPFARKASVSVGVQRRSGAMLAVSPGLP